MLKRLIFLTGFIYAASAHADLKPDVLECDAQRATRNAAMEATVGVSGGCDMGKATNNAMDGARDNMSGQVDDAKDNMPGKRQDRSEREAARKVTDHN